MTVTDFIKANDKFILMPHRNPDGDCLGSVTALAYALRSIGKTAFVSLPDEPSDRLAYLWDEALRTPADFCAEACIAVDVASPDMLGDLRSVFEQFDKTACIDHHATNGGFATANLIKPHAAAAGEIVFELIRDELCCELTEKICTNLYSAIVSDTGCFRYSNTTPHTHRIAASLMEHGAAASAIIKRLFETTTMKSLAVSAELINGARFFENGLVCVMTADYDMLSRYGMTFDMVDEFASMPRTIEGVEVGVFLKVKSENEVKISLRSNAYADVSAIAAALGGGGHARAAGVTVNGSRDEAISKILAEIKKHLK